MVDATVLIVAAGDSGSDCALRHRRINSWHAPCVILPIAPGFRARSYTVVRTTPRGRHQALYHQRRQAMGAWTLQKRNPSDAGRCSVNAEPPVLDLIARTYSLGRYRSTANNYHLAVWLSLRAQPSGVVQISWRCDHGGNAGSAIPNNRSSAYPS
jgi:hypothetical protein